MLRRTQQATPFLVRPSSFVKATDAFLLWPSSSATVVPSSFVKTSSYHSFNDASERVPKSSSSSSSRHQISYNSCITPSIEMMNARIISTLRCYHSSEKKTSGKKKSTSSDVNTTTPNTTTHNEHQKKKKKNNKNDTNSNNKNEKLENMTNRLNEACKDVTDQNLLAAFEALEKILASRNQQKKNANTNNNNKCGNDRFPLLSKNVSEWCLSLQENGKVDKPSLKEYLVSIAQTSDSRVFLEVYDLLSPASMEESLQSPPQNSSSTTATSARQLKKKEGTKTKSGIDTFEAFAERVCVILREVNRVGDLKQLRALKGRTLVDSSLGEACFLVNKEVAEETCSRHIEFVPIKQALVTKSVLEGFGISETWKTHPSKVVIFAGSSGSGKTVSSLLVARNVVLTGGGGFGGGAPSRNVVFYFRAQAVEIESGTENQKKKKQNRNDTVKELIRSAIKSCLDNAEVVQMQDTSCHCILVVDEVGQQTEFLRGLIAVASDLSVELHNKFFADQQTSFKQCRVHFIAAGTGAAYATAAVGSDPNRYRTFNLDSVNKDMSVFRALVQESEDIPMKHHLLRIAPSSSTSGVTGDVVVGSPKSNHDDASFLSVAERTASDLVINPRSAALMYASFKSISPKYQSSSLPAFRQRLNVFVPNTVEAYFHCSGLQTSRSPYDVLRVALSVSLHRFPFLPINLRYDEFFINLLKNFEEADNRFTSLKKFDSSMNSYEDGDLYFELCVKKGVLVDGASRSGSKDEWGKLVPDYFDENFAVVPKAKQDSYNGKQKGTFLTLPLQTSRFQLPPSHVAMLRSGCGLDLHHASAHSYGLEANTADFCFLCAANARIIKSLYTAVDAEMTQFNNKTMKDFFEKFVSTTQDPLFELKQLLRFDSENLDHIPEGAVSLVLFDSSLKNVGLYKPELTFDSSSKKYTDEEKNDERKANEETKRLYAQSALKAAARLRDEISVHVRKKKAVVFLSREMDSFADVVVVTHKKVILLQCKQKIDVEKQNSSWVPWFDELHKMCYYDVRAADKSIPKKKFADEKLRELWLSAIIDGSCSFSSSSGSMEDIRNLNEEISEVKVDDVERFCAWLDSEAPPNDKNRDAIPGFKFKYYSSSLSTSSSVSVYPCFVVEGGRSLCDSIIDSFNQTTTISSPTITTTNKVKLKGTRRGTMFGSVAWKPPLLTVIPRSDSSAKNKTVEEPSPFYPVPSPAFLNSNLCEVGADLHEI